MKIAIWTYLKWAFGQTHRAVKKYSNHQIDLFSWNILHPKDAFDSYDLINIPVVQAYRSFLNMYPSVKHKSCCSTRGKAELFYYSPKAHSKHNITEKEVDTGLIPIEMVNYINSLGMMACVSQELVSMLKEQTTAKIFYTPCGVDEEIFKGEITEHDKLVVLCPTTKELIGMHTHRYDVKRWGLALEIEKRLPQITFKFLDKMLTMDEMPDYYRQGDIILCLSHSEGNPLGIMEAGAIGVVPVTTSVGDIPSYIELGLNGEIISGNLIENTIKLLIWFDANRQALLDMKKNIQKTILEKRTWKKLIPYWDNYFSSVGGINAG